MPTLVASLSLTHPQHRRDEAPKPELKDDSQCLHHIWTMAYGVSMKCSRHPESEKCSDTAMWVEGAGCWQGT